MSTPRGQFLPLFPISYHAGEPLQFGSSGSRKAFAAPHQERQVTAILNFALARCIEDIGNPGGVTGIGKSDVGVIPATCPLNGVWQTQR
jgi:hypothetical protein